jgi:hypothetical protein
MQYLYNRRTGSKQMLEDGFFRNCKTLDLLLFPPSYILNALHSGDIIELHIRQSEKKQA